MGEIIPVRTINDARTAIAFLRANNAGRSTFLALDKLDISSSAEERPRDTDGFIGYLDDLVSYPGEYESVVKLLLGRVALFESDEVVMNANGRWEHYTRVSIDGLVILPSAMIAGGKIVGGVIGRRHELDEIRGKAEELSYDLTQNESQFAEEKNRLETIRSELRSAVVISAKCICSRKNCR